MTNDVVVGLGGWLFLRGGSNSPFDYLDGSKIFGEALVSRWCDLLRARVNKLGRAKYLHLFAPNKETIYSREACLTEESLTKSPLAVLMNSSEMQQDPLLRKCIIDPTNYFRRIALQHQLYWKTDSHWSPTGCFAAYQLVCSALNVQPVKDLLGRPFGSGDVAMDLGGKMTPPVKESVRFYNFATNAKRIYANSIVEVKEARKLENEAGLHVGSNVVFFNEAAPDPRKVILFGDSFSEYRTVLLTGMLAETFREVHFVWSVYLDLDYIAKHDPDIVLSEIVERFMPSVPNDSFDLDQYALKKVAEYAE
jgi:hypothetical protein